MDGDAFLYVVGNHVCFCATAVHIGAVRFFLQKLFEKAKLNKYCYKFIFFNALDTNKLALIQEKGIIEIQLKASLYKASIDYIRRKAQVAGIIGGIGESIKAILGHDGPAEDEALRVGLTLRVDGRSKSGIHLGQKTLTELAKNIIESQEEDDDYVIFLKSGEKIKPSEIILRQSVDLESEGKTVKRDAAFAALLAYYKNLAGAGRLEQ